MGTIMHNTRKTVSGIIVVASYMIIQHSVYIVACDGVGASSSVGECWNNGGQGYYSCTSFTKAADCGNYALLDTKHVQQNFPTSCIAAANSNCNTASQNCYINAVCGWMNGACTETGTTGAWVQLGKRTTAECGG
jgi:hypothetical protein